MSKVDKWKVHDAWDKEFDTSKKRILKELQEFIDRSKKGAIDEHVEEVMELLNTHDSFVTTSSCSGRCAVFAEGDDKKQSGACKEGAFWICLLLLPGLGQGKVHHLAANELMFLCHVFAFLEARLVWLFCSYTLLLGL